jgi:hypothetical protein
LAALRRCELLPGKAINIPVYNGFSLRQLNVQHMGTLPLFASQGIGTVAVPARPSFTFTHQTPSPQVTGPCTVSRLM